MTSDCLVDDVTKWPSVDLGKIFSYILKLKEFDAEYVRKYKDQKGYSYYQSGFVGTIWYFYSKEISINLCFLFCKVTPSQSVTDERELWVAIDKVTMDICTAWCSCIAGTGECCNHVLATLYKLEYAVSNLFTDPACTSMPCGWNKGTRKSVAAARILDLRIRKDKRTSETKKDNIISNDLINFDPRREPHRLVRDEEKEQFLETFATIRKSAVIFKSLESRVGNDSTSTREFRSLVSEADMYATKHEGMSEAELVRGFMESLTLTGETQTAIERNTRGQADNPLWFELRKGRITASKFHDVYTKVNSVVSNRSQTEPRTTPLVSKLIYRDENLDHLPAIRWGQEHEEDALKSFYANEAVKHVDFKLEKCGLYTHQTKPYIGASPDALLTCKCHGISPVEIKCPYTIRNESVIDSASQCDFLVEINDQVCLRPSHKYYTQLTGEMAMIRQRYPNCKQGYFVVYTTVNTFVQAVPFDQTLWSNVEQNLDIFFKGYIVKALLGLTPLVYTTVNTFVQAVPFDQTLWSNVEQNLDIFFKGYNVKALLGLTLLVYCTFCEKVILNEKEIGNDMKECSVCYDMCGGWIHFHCAGVSEVDENSEWFCDKCLVTLSSR